MTIQASGGNARLSWRKEVTPGVPNFPLVVGGMDTTLSEAVQPGATQIKVVSASGAAAGDIIRVGDDVNPMYLVIDSGYVSGTTIGIDTAKTPILFRLEAGEIVQEVTPGGFKRMPALASIDPVGTIGKIVSGALSGARGTARSRGGNISVEFNVSVELSIEHIHEWIVYMLGEDYSCTGTAVGGGLSTATNAAIDKGDTTLPLTALTNGNAGDLVQVGAGDLAEVVKIDGAWNGSDNPVPLDASTPFRKGHASGVAAVEVAAPFTIKAKRGPTIAAMTMLLHLTDIDGLALIKGAKFNTINMSGFQPDDNTITMQLGVIAQSFQVLGSNIFGTPAALAHSFYAPWEGKVKQADAVLTTIENFQFAINNDIPSNAQRTIGSRFRRSVTPGRGSCSGSFTYQLSDISRIKDLIIGTRRKLEADFVYTEDNNHALNFTFPRGSFTGDAFPGITESGPLTVSQEFDAEIDDTLESDVQVTIKSDQYLLAA